MPTRLTVYCTRSIDHVTAADLKAAIDEADVHTDAEIDLRGRSSFCGSIKKSYVPFNLTVSYVDEGDELHRAVVRRMLANGARVFRSYDEARVAVRSAT